MPTAPVTPAIDPTPLTPEIQLAIYPLEEVEAHLEKQHELEEPERWDGLE